MEEKSKAIIKIETKLPDTNWQKELELVKQTTAKGCTNEEFKLLLYLSKEYGLNPLKREVYCVKYGDSPAQIFLSRDGALAIAHRSGQFEGMETTVELEQPDPTAKIQYVNRTPKPISATCTIWKKGHEKAFRETVYFIEYDLKQALWLKKPITMIKKVAEAQCLRKAFNIHGVYDSSEFPDEPVESEPKEADYTVKEQKEPEV